MDAIRCMELVLCNFSKKHPGPKHQWIIGARGHFIPPAKSSFLLTNTLVILRISKKDTASLSHVREWEHGVKAFVSTALKRLRCWRKDGGRDGTEVIDDAREARISDAQWET